MTDNLQPSTRQCKKCGNTKPLDQFATVYSKASRGQNYRQHSCQDCAKVSHAARMRRARLNNSEKYRVHQREHRARHLERVRRQRRESGIRRKMRVMAAYGGKCACCGETELSMLTMDHIHEDGNKHRDELNGGRGREVSVEMYCWLERNKCPDGFQVLCYNCNISKHRGRGVCAHKSGEGSTTIPQGSSLQAIGKRSAGRPYRQG